LDTPYVIVERDIVDSTQELAALEARTSGRPALVVAGRQRAGRGRLGRPWWNADRALAASFAFRPPWATEAWPLLPLVAALAARDAIVATVGRLVDLKWPNDLMVDEAKIGGILSEASGPLVTIGLGVDLWWADPPAGAGSLYPADPGPGVAAGIARRWADRLLARLERPAGDWGRDEYRGACITLGRDVEWEGTTGRAVTVSTTGALVVETATGLVEVIAGDVRLRGVPHEPDARGGGG